MRVRSGATRPLLQSAAAASLHLARAGDAVAGDSVEREGEEGVESAVGALGGVVPVRVADLDDVRRPCHAGYSLAVAENL